MDYITYMLEKGQSPEVSRVINKRLTIAKKFDYMETVWKIEEIVTENRSNNSLY